MTYNMPPVQYPEGEEKTPAWANLIGFIGATVIAGVGFHAGWNLLGLLW